MKPKSFSRPSELEKQEISLVSLTERLDKAINKQLVKLKAEGEDTRELEKLLEKK